MKRTAICGVLIALAMIFSFIETLIPLTPGVPGIKLGLANLVIVFAIYRFDRYMAVVISLVRVFLVAFLFSNMSAMIYSLAGAALSLVMMLILHKFTDLHVVTVSICGAIGHIGGQMIVAGAVTTPQIIIYYAPGLIVSAIVTGAVIGMVASILINRIPIDIV